MSQISTDNDDNCSLAGSDFVQLDRPNKVADQEAQKLQEAQFGFQQNPLDWTMNTGSICNNGNGLKELKWIIANLEVFLGGNN
jgi:hypothetical protein